MGEEKKGRQRNEAGNSGGVCYASLNRMDIWQEEIGEVAAGIMIHEDRHGYIGAQ